MSEDDQRMELLMLRMARIWQYLVLEELIKARETEVEAWVPVLDNLLTAGMKATDAVVPTMDKPSIVVSVIAIWNDLIREAIESAFDNVMSEMLYTLISTGMKRCQEELEKAASNL